MSDQKISQLPAAATLTGTELVELVQSGANAQTTAQAIAALAPPVTQASSNGNPSATFGVGFGSHIKWTAATANFSATLTALASSAGATFTWSAASGTPVVQHSNPGASTIYAASGMVINTQAGGAINQAAELNASGQFGTNGANQLWRLLNPTLPIGGFTLTFYGGVDAMPSAGALFFGMAPTNNGIPGTQVPSALLNCVGFAKDTGDTNLQFIYNNGSGTATKTDTGITIASIIRHLCKIVISCDVLGNIVATLTDLEAGGVSVTYSVATATAKLPAANTSVQPHFFASTAAQTSAVGFAYHSIFTTGGYV